MPFATELTKRLGIRGTLITTSSSNNTKFPQTATPDERLARQHNLIGASNSREEMERLTLSQCPSCKAA